MLLLAAVAVLIFGGLGVLVWYAVAAPESHVLCTTFACGKKAQGEHPPSLALTFDDGPGAETARILDILKSAEIRATFFLCGGNVEQFPELARRIAAEGHEIGNHTYSHPRLLGRTPGKIALEIDRAQKVIEHTTGVRPRWFRPPYGLRWFGLATILQQRNLRAAMWCVNGRDWKRPSEQITETILRQAHPGAIALLHDGMPPGEEGNRLATAEALPAILRLLGSKYRFVTLSEMESTNS